MWKHNLKSAFRNLKANRLFSLLNILGLAVGIAAGIVLLLWVNKESSYDNFHSKADRIYNISAHFKAEGAPNGWDVVPGAISTMAKDVPGIQSTVRFAYGGNQVLSDRQQKKVFDQVKVGYVDSSFLNVFDFGLLAGNRQSLLTQINSIVLTESLARKIFGTIDAIGKTVLFDTTAYAVSGVLADFPENTSIHYDALFPMAVYARRFTANGGNGDWKTIDEDLGNYDFTTYVLLRSDNHPVEVGAKITAAFKKARGNDITPQFKLQNIRDQHLITVDGNKADLQLVRILLLISLLILFIASINYINLSTASALGRSKDVGVRKVIGATRKSLFFQFVLETVIVFVIAVFVAFILLWALSPVINYLTHQSILDTLWNWQTLVIIVLALIGPLLASCIYPAALLSSFHPIAAISGKLRSGAKTSLIRKGLVVFQFGISFALLVCTLIMGKQMNYILNKDLGYNKDYVFSAFMPNKATDHLDAIRAALDKHPSIESVGFTNSWDLSNVQNSTGDIEWTGKPVNNQMIIGQMNVDQFLIPTMQYQFLEGGNFVGDSSDQHKFIVNESAVREMGLKPPYVGQKLTFHDIQGEIQGVLKDFNFKPLNEKITPILFYKAGNPSMLYVRAKGKNLSSAIDAVKKQYDLYADISPFSYNFLDKNVEKHYEHQYRTGTLFKTFSCIAIFLSCLGLLGLATFAVQARTKEIGVRKILGANVGGIIKLVSKEFMILVLLGSLIFAPISYWAISKWLQEFAYKIPVDFFSFLWAITIVICIAFLTIGYKVIGAARANPVKSLKTE